MSLMSGYGFAWQVDPVHGLAASCNFWSYAQMNIYGNMQFYSGSTKSGADSAPLTCSTNTPGSNRDYRSLNRDQMTPLINIRGAYEEGFMLKCLADVKGSLKSAGVE